MWPTPQDYNEAIQNPKLCFIDQELRDSAPEINHLGLPKPMSGSFASVYHMYGQPDEFAVRCFLHNFADQELRYARISEFLTGNQLDYTVRFSFLPRGIQVHNNWYPALKMQWISGESLIPWIERHLNDQFSLRALRDRFADLCLRLSDLGIAHGDLQHGNILIVGSDLKLVDYDGMYVPTLKDLSSNEIGHRHYQHPSRGQQHFENFLDNFAAWSIYTSLECLSVDPQLWYALGGGDDCLLFKHEDYIQPEHSVAFRFLENHGSEQIRNAARRLRALLYSNVEDVPRLGSQISGAERLGVLRPPQTLPDWLLGDGKAAPPAVLEAHAPKYTPTPGHVDLYELDARAANAVEGRGDREAPPYSAGARPTGAGTQAASAAGPPPRYMNLRLVNQTITAEGKPRLVVAPQQATMPPAHRAAPKNVHHSHVPVLIQHATNGPPVFEAPTAASSYNPGGGKKLFGLIPQGYVGPVLAITAPIFLLSMGLIMTTVFGHHTTPPRYGVQQPSNTSNATWSQKGVDLFDEGKELMTSNKYDAAIAKFQAAMNEFSTLSHAEYRIASCEARIGLCHQKKGDNKLAVEWLSKAETNYQQDGRVPPELFGAKGQSYMDLKDYAAAADAYQSQVDYLLAQQNRQSEATEANEKLRAAALCMLRKGEYAGLDYYRQSVDPEQNLFRAYPADLCRELNEVADDLERRKNYVFAHEVRMLTWQVSNSWPDQFHTSQIEALQALKKNCIAQRLTGEAARYDKEIADLVRENQENARRYGTGGSPSTKTPSVVHNRPRM